VAWREAVAADPPARYRGETYWARPLPGFGDPKARLLIVGLAPAAHGGNRTGRIFTGDRSGEWLFRALHKAGFANQPTSVHRNDGLKLGDCYIAAVVRSAPPANRPTPEERDNCLTYLVRELSVLKNIEVVVALGAFGWDGALRALSMKGVDLPAPRPRFGHLASASVGPYELIGSYHPSQQNTFTGKLTEESFDEVFRRARSLLGDC
jgi:uracil-DNA glycosylase family 4